ncbi:hypothetical protein EDC04DRAFT_2761810 [Pisolithus marmoratus]|nr:hypothetical protein EDC04DRAFT_2761810 [Pisolithus marmoratus]
MRSSKANNKSSTGTRSATVSTRSPVRRSRNTKGNDQPKETTTKSSKPNRGVHVSNRDKGQEEVSNKRVNAGRSKKTAGSKDESQQEASRKRASTSIDSEGSQQKAEPPRKILKRTLRFQRDSLGEDSESSNHEVDVDELEQEDEVDELQDDDEMPQTDERAGVDQKENGDKVDDDEDDEEDDEYIEDNLDSASKQPAVPDDEKVKSHADSKGKYKSNVTEIGDKAADLDEERKRGGKPSSRRPRGSKFGKVSLASFENPGVRRLVKVGHRRLRQHVATVDAFPPPAERDELCWRLVQESAVKEPGLERVLGEVEKEKYTKERLLDYIWGAATQVRGELVAKARMAVPTAYGLQGELQKGNALFDVLKWLIQQGKLIHSGIDAKTMTCDESKPWKNSIFSQLIKMQWWGPKGEGRRLGSDPPTNPYLNAPVTMLALVATAVECVLTGLFSGGTIDFNENVEPLHEMLAEFKTRSPTYLRMVQESIQQGMGVQPMQKVSPLMFDFSGLEEAAKMELEGGVA